MIISRSVDVIGESLVGVTPDMIYSILAQRLGRVGSLKREPAFKKQNEILDDRGSRFKALNATRRSAKSHTEVMDHIEICIQYPKSRTVYIGLTLDSVSEICWDVFKEFNEKNNLGLVFNETKRIIKYPNGSRTRLFGLDSSARQQAKILGQKLRKVSIDEAGSITINLEEFCFQKVRPALIDLAPESWLTLLGTCENIPKTYFQKVTESNCINFDWKVHKWTAYQNPFMARQWKAEIEEITKNNPKALETSQFKTHYLNQWVQDDDLMIIPAKKMDIVDELPRTPSGAIRQDWYYTLGVDLGYNDDTSFTLIASSWNVPSNYVVFCEKQSEMDFTDVANRIKKFKSEYPIGALIVDGSNLQGKVEMQKRLGLPEMESAEKTGKPTYLRLLRDDVISGNLKFLRGNCDILVSEWESLQWKNEMKDKEDDRCANHASDSCLYAWRHTFVLRADPKFKRPSEDSKEYEIFLEEKEMEIAQSEQEDNEVIYGSEEQSYFS